MPEAAKDIIEVTEISFNDIRSTFKVTNKSGKTIEIEIGTVSNNTSYYSGDGSFESTEQPSSYEGEDEFIKVGNFNTSIIFTKPGKHEANVVFWSNDKKLAELDAAEGTVTYEDVNVEDIPEVEVPKEAPVIGTQTKIKYGAENPQIVLTSNKAFKVTPSQDDLGLDFGETSLVFNRAIGNSTTCNIDCQGVATDGTIKLQTKPEAYEEPKNLLESNEAYIVIDPYIPPELDYAHRYLNASQVARLIVETHRQLGGGSTNSAVHNIVISYEVLKDGASGLDGTFALGDKVYIKVTVENRGSVPETNITIPIVGTKFTFESEKEHSDSVTYDEINIKIASIPVSQNVVFHLSHTIDEDDTTKGFSANLEAQSDNGGFSGKIEIPLNSIEQPVHKLIAVTAIEGTPTGTSDKYTVSDTVYIKITVTNSGNQTETNISIPFTDSKFEYDDSKDKSESVTYEGESKTVKVTSLEEAAEFYFYVKHVIAETDLGVGVSETAHATSDAAAVDIPLKIEVTSVEVAMHLIVLTSTVDKELGVPTGQESKFTTNDKVVVKVNLQNNGNVTEKNLKLPLADTGFTYDDENAGSEHASKDETTAQVSQIAIKGNEYFYVNHTIAESDLTVGYSHSVNGTYDSGGIAGTLVIPPEDVEVRRETFTVTKTLSNSPADGDTWGEGETPQWDIVITNTGNVTLTNVEVEELTDGVTFIEDAGYTIE